MQFTLQNVREYSKQKVPKKGPKGPEKRETRRQMGKQTVAAAVVIAVVVFLSCPLVKKHADLSGSFLYSQSTMKNMYSKPTNRTKLSIPMKTKSIA